MFTPELISPILKPVIDATFYHDAKSNDSKGMLKITKTQYKEIVKLYEHAQRFIQK